MQNVIVGTAGHVDHGKTCLIQALTGTDTDRLAEEKKRGITIDLGFACILDEPGLHIGIIDVPGHEKFVKNMLAGIGGIDLALLVIALDEGIQPQTVEHFEILKMLGIRRGLIALTKSDLAGQNQAALVEEEVDRLVKGSFLERAPRIRVSSFTGENIPLIKRTIIEMARATERPRENGELFRLPIDRVFTMEGFGTVATGTLLEGRCSVGQELMVYPGQRLAKVRGIQSHGQKEETALAGQRTALNLAGVRKEELKRGQVLAYPGSLSESIFADVWLSLFGTAKRRLKSGNRVHVCWGSAQLTAKAVLLDKEEIKAGEGAFAQLRFDAPICVKKGDRFIIRFYSPVETFGGGVFLDGEARKHKRGQKEVLSSLEKKRDGTAPEVLELLVQEEGMRFPDTKTLARKMNLTEEETGYLLTGLQEKKSILSLNDQTFMGKGAWEQAAAASREILERFHRENPLVKGMDPEEFRSRLGARLYLPDMQRAEILLDELVKQGAVTMEDGAVAEKGFQICYSPEDSRLMDHLIHVYLQAGVEPSSTGELLKDDKVLKDSNRKQVRQILEDLVSRGVLVKVRPDMLMHRKHWEKALAMLKEYCSAHPAITLAQFRDLLGTSRKYAILLLETYDALKITKRTGNTRTLYQGAAGKNQAGNG